MSGLTVDLVRPLARKTSTAATIAAVVLTLGAPITLYLQTRRARASQATSYADRMASLVQDVVIERPDLWYYDTPKLAQHLGFLVEDSDIVGVAVIDDRGRRVDVPEPDGRRLLAWWARAPVYRGETVVAEVWVAVDATKLISRVLAMTVLAWLLASLLATALYVLPVRVVGLAEAHITSLLEKLEGARRELAGLNEELEHRVEERSRQLSETAEALRQSEARLREVAGRAVEATEQERQRVARELHDSTGQMLTAVRLSLQVLDALMGPESPARPKIDELERLVDETIDEVRRIAMDLHPAALDRLGLIEGLTELCSGVASRAGVEIVFEAREVPHDLPAGVQSSCFRLVQEALTNAVRYAEAELIMVGLSYERGSLEISVADDGKGFVPNEAEGGFGLRGMRDRVALLGGRLSIESAPGRGVEIVIEIPVEKGQQP